jgi:diacylglycerol O-acyltransferase
MPQYMYERLSAQDNSFLAAEQSNTPLHIAAVGIYELSNAAARDGGVDIRRFKRFIESRLHEIPRYRQKLMWVPIENRPVWIDDPHFNIDYHIRHAALPRPGSIEELKKLTARITTRELDRSRPLWEIWIIEGLDDNRFAIVSKIHHCMIDGAAGADIAQILNSPFPDVEIPEPRPFMPRPAPSEAELFVDAAQRMVGMPMRVLRSLAAVGTGTEDLREEVTTRVRALGDVLGLALKQSSDTPLNGPLGPHRRIDWLTLPLDDVKAVRRTLNCTVNDVVLATVTGAVRQYLRRRNVDLSEIEFRVSAPVSMRKDAERGEMGNRVSSWIVRLPVEQEDPLESVKIIRETTQELKDSRQALGLEMMMNAAEFAPSSLMALGARAASGPINMIVTNVPGPQFPLYTLGAKLLEMLPLVPLLEGTGLGIALFSYDGKLHVGLNAEYELVPDLGTFTALFAQSFMTLADRAGIEGRETSDVAETATAQPTSVVSCADMPSKPETEPSPPAVAALAS